MSLAALRETKMTRTTTLKFLLAILLLITVCHGQVPRRQTAASVPVDPDGLVEAARNGNLRSVESILAAGVDVTQYGGRDRYEIARILKGAGAKQ